MPEEETVWFAEEHTLAKHKILKGYLDAWSPIMARRAEKLRGRPPLYIDAFAGPGIYKNAVDGSPVVAIKAVLDHSVPTRVPIRMSFIELDEARFGHLQRRITGFESLNRSRLVIENVLNCSCEEGLGKLLESERQKFGNLETILVFLDQFGYSQAPMAMIRQIMEGASCEALIYLDFRRMNHTLTDPGKKAALTRAFGSDVWMRASNLEGREREKCLRDSYKTALNQAGADYVWDFELRGQRNELISWLFFCTSNYRGLEEMKRAMYQLDLTGNFRFSDRHVGQFNLLTKSFDQDWLAVKLEDHFHEQKVKIEAIRKYVLTETPLIRFKKALAQLENREKIRVTGAPIDRRQGTFKVADSTEIEFLAGFGEQGQLF